MLDIESIVVLFAEAQTMARVEDRVAGLSWHNMVRPGAHTNPIAQRAYRLAWKKRHPEANAASVRAYNHRKAGKGAA